MSDLEELRARVRALEAVYRGVDTDTSDNTAAIQATHHTVQALSITQSQHTGWLRELRTDVSQLKDDVKQLRGDVVELKVGQTEIVRMLTQLIEGQA